MSEDEKPDTAGMNEVFICMNCSKAFMDRAATVPMAVKLKSAVIGVARMEPHVKYPDDPDLAKLVYEDVPDQVVYIAKAASGECCPTFNVLCNASRIRFRKELDGLLHIVGAEHLE
jgi:hypothetical protein